jgi:hypothetical protein
VYWRFYDSNPTVRRVAARNPWQILDLTVAFLCLVRYRRCAVGQNCFMPEQLWITELLNRSLAGPVTGLLRMLHIQPNYPQATITNAVAMEMVVLVIL